MEIEYVKLSPKEDEIYRLILKGLGVPDISMELNKHPATVQQQICNIYNKRYCNTKAELMAQRIAELEDEVEKLRHVMSNKI